MSSALWCPAISVLRILAHDQYTDTSNCIADTTYTHPEVGAAHRGRRTDRICGALGWPANRAENPLIITCSSRGMLMPMATVMIGLTIAESRVRVTVSTSQVISGAALWSSHRSSVALLACLPTEPSTHTITCGAHAVPMPMATDRTGLNIAELGLG
jgi:hypothetical protein